MTAPWVESKHSRGPGGLFAAQSAASGKPTGAWAAGPIRHGTGRRGAPDPRVKALQQKLNALGFTDERGRPLLVDGIDGNHTTAAVKAFQRANGMKPTGVVDAKTMVAILTGKPAPKPARARDRMRGRTSARRPAKQASMATKKPTSSPPPPKPYADRGRGFSRTGSGAST
ncbi:peptidoglycan-binding protein [Dactylosporangium roseum]|uniref:Peptidoglycan-binding protein n=1 Tax=Dactylosporangium roseum TaxID=47989 RepID=A0ABY5Z9J9_9ACTN|nr:peptidoglycan-binding domain-containing protein [Dactylosporangium roseum]UWZ37497.1 peptidoglycan-binding protein [Dactylosporangium roseum]